MSRASLSVYKNFDDFLMIFDAFRRRVRALFSRFYPLHVFPTADFEKSTFCLSPWRLLIAIGEKLRLPNPQGSNSRTFSARQSGPAPIMLAKIDQLLYLVGAGRVGRSWPVWRSSCPIWLEPDRFDARQTGRSHAKLSSANRL